MSYGWWMDKHTRHHANPNHEDHDPTSRRTSWSGRPSRPRAAKGLPRFLGRWQAYLFFPLLTLEGFNLHVASVRALLRPTMKHRPVEASLLVAHIVLYLAALFPVLSPGKAVAFLLLHQALFGVYLGCTFAPNHKGMPMLTGRGPARLPPASGADLAQRARRRGGHRARRAQLPDRAPPLPQHADAEPAPCPADRPAVLRRRSASPTWSPGSSAPTRRRCATCTR